MSAASSPAGRRRPAGHLPGLADRVRDPPAAGLRVRLAQLEAQRAGVARVELSLSRVDDAGLHTPSASGGAPRDLPAEHLRLASEPTLAEFDHRARRTAERSGSRDWAA